jgi:RNA polymerase sigma-70 factor (ECF subfamily)
LEAWSEFVRLYTPLVFAHCRRHGLQEADAADVAQEVMRVGF